MFKEQARSMPTKGEIYVHFKGNRYIIIDIAMHTETKELLVVYQALSDNKIYARPLVMFMSPVDKEKYPYCQLQYRFELEQKHTIDKAKIEK